MNFRYALGEILRETRNEKFMTLRNLSKKSNVAIAYISEVERGRKEASSEVLECLTDGLGVSLADLIILAGWKMKVANESIEAEFPLDIELINA